MKFQMILSVNLICPGKRSMRGKMQGDHLKLALLYGTPHKVNLLSLFYWIQGFPW